MSKGPGRLGAAARRRSAPRFVLAFGLSIVTAAALASMVYLATTALPYLASSPTTDPVFGKLNQCLITASVDPRVGFAASPDASSAAAFSGKALAICALNGQKIVSRTLAQPGVFVAAFDFGGTLWIGTEAPGNAATGLFKLRPGVEKLEPVGALSPIALVGHRRGVVAVDRNGGIASLSGDGAALEHAALPAAPLNGVQLGTNREGSLVSLVTGGGVFVYRADTLERIRGEAPCEVEFAWWLEGNHLLLSCGPSSKSALKLEALTGERETAAKRKRAHSVLLSIKRTYVQPCEQLPCTAPAP